MAAMVNDRMQPILRPARLDDIPALEALIAVSARALSREDYSEAEIESACAHVFGVDSELVEDGTYYVAEIGGDAVACGGWSRRRTLFGGDRYAGRVSGLLDPAQDAAKIRAFFVHPDFARRGLGALILRHCEAAARAAGFTRMEMMATLPGVRLYRALGYAGGEIVAHPQPDGVTLRFMPMSRALD
ncbi:MAG: GNAT family N-acetyltransferase [Asticcacaulis sp.]